MGDARRKLDAAGLLWRSSVPLKNLCHWKIGGPADFVVESRSGTEVAAAREIAADCGLPYLVIGHGSNMLFDDAGFRGMVIKLGSKFSKTHIDGKHVRAEAGIWVPALARMCAAKGLSGLEHAVGIPGNLGGLVFMNGGSMRKNIGDVVVSVEILDECGNISVMPADKCEFSYRHSVFQHKNAIVLGAELSLAESSAEEVRNAMLAVLKERKGKFPLSLPNCGSVFSNDSALYASYGPPGMVIDRAGLKGLRVGNAQVSEVHANFIVNLGGASSSDVFALIRLVREKILEKTGFTLKCEVRYAAPDGRCAPLDAFL